MDGWVTGWLAGGWRVREGTFIETESNCYNGQVIFDTTWALLSLLGFVHCFMPGCVSWGCVFHCFQWFIGWVSTEAEAEARK